MFDFIKLHLKESLFKNSYIMILISLSISFFGFLFWFLLARYYPPTDVGYATVLLSTSMLIGIFSSFGFGIAVIRYLGKNRDKNNMINSYLSIILFSTLFLTIICIYFGSSTLFEDSNIINENFSFILIFLIYTILYAIFLLLGNIFISLKATVFSLYMNIINNILRIPLPIFFISFGVKGILASTTFAIVISLFIGLFFFLPKITEGYHYYFMIDRTVIKNTIKFSLENYFAEIFLFLPTLLMPIIILNELGPESAAYFYIAWSITTIVSIFPSAITTSLFTEGSYDRESLPINILKSLKFLFLFLIPITIILCIFGYQILELFGKEYAENAVYLLYLLAISRIPFAIIQIFMSIKRVQFEIKSIILINFLNAFFIIVGTLFFINSFGLIIIGISWVIIPTIISMGILYSWKKYGF